MKWKNVQFDGLPDDNQQVLICVDGVYYVSTYLHARQVFSVNEQEITHQFFPDQKTIYWMDFNSASED